MSVTTPQAPRRILNDISVQQIGTEVLVYDPRRHKAFCLNPSSSVIWRLADGMHTIAEISAAASAELGAPVSEEFVIFALEELRQDGLIEPTPNAEPMSSISRRALLQKLGAGGAMLLPAIAAIVAPTAAQAYSGCVDCSATPSRTPARGQRRQPISPVSTPPK